MRAITVDDVMTEMPAAHATRATVLKVVIAQRAPPRASHQIYVTKAYCRMIGIDGLSEADALARLHGLVAPALPSDLTCWLSVVRPAS